MGTTIFLGLITIALSFASGWRFGFKEEYKLFHDKIFVKHGRYRSDFWPISRTKNRRIWKITQVLAIISGIICVAFMISALVPRFESTISLLIVIMLMTVGFSAIAVIAYRYGKLWGKKQAPKIVEKTCEKFRVEFFPLD